MRPASVLAYVLALLLAFTGQQVALARGQVALGDQAVLCLGGGLVAVTLDAEGKPVGPGHICPDATLAFVPDMDLPQAALTPVELSQLAVVARQTLWSGQSASVLPPSRGPPLSV